MSSKVFPRDCGKLPFRNCECQEKTQTCEFPSGKTVEITNFNRIFLKFGISTVFSEGNSRKCPLRQILGSFLAEFCNHCKFPKDLSQMAFAIS